MRLSQADRVLPSQTRPAISSQALLLFFAMHVAFGLANTTIPGFSRFHLIATLATGLVIILTTRRIQQVIYVIAYIAGAEIYWRMTDAGIFWEIAKYAAIGFSGLTLFQLPRHIPVRLGLYMVSLLPAIVGTLSVLSFDATRVQLSINFSGPVALFMVSWLCSLLALDRRDMQYVCIAVIAPIISIATITLIAVMNAGAEAWALNESSFEASGGFGPNQVSTALGLGVVAVWLLLIVTRRRGLTLFGLFGVGVWFLIQAILTYSRGGVLNGLAAVGASFLILVRNRSQFFRVLLPILMIGYFLLNTLLPSLETLTGSTLSSRYAVGSTSSRELVISSDLQIFLANPITGVGIGMAGQERIKMLGVSLTAHTEYTRVLAEHGLLGVFALVLLGSMMLENFWRNRANTITWAFVTSCIVWGLLYMTHAATRTVAPAFLIGLTFATYTAEDVEVSPQPERSDADKRRQQRAPRWKTRFVRY